MRPRGLIEPDADWVEIYAEQRERYRALYPALRSVQLAPPLRSAPAPLPVSAHNLRLAASAGGMRATVT